MAVFAARKNAVNGGHLTKQANEKGGEIPAENDREKQRRELKKLARARRQRQQRRRVERHDWGLLWRDGRLPAANDELDEASPEAEDMDVAEAAGAELTAGKVRRSLDEDIDDAAPNARPEVGMVIGLHKRGCTLLAGEEKLEGHLRQHLHALQQQAIAPGDLVEFHRCRETALVDHVLERKTRLSRPDPLNPRLERVIAANIELAVIIISCRMPDPHPRLIDRYLIAAERGGITPLICVNKIDLGGEWEARMLPYRKMNVTVIACSALTGENIAALREQIAGKLCVFVGHSGTGKTSLLNALQPGLHLRTRSVHGPTGRGRHTTVVARLLDLGDGAKVIDTPGIREFGLWRMGPDELRWHFPEFEQAPRCKFNDCTHSHEPLCGVKQALEAGDIPPARYESYLRILESLR